MLSEKVSRIVSERETHSLFVRANDSFTNFKTFDIWCAYLCSNNSQSREISTFLSGMAVSGFFTFMETFRSKLCVVYKLCGKHLLRNCRYVPWGVHTG